MKILMVGNPKMKNANLLKILTNKLKYTTPEVEIVNFDNMPDIITTSSADSSMQMAKYSPEELTEMSNKKKNEKEPPMLTENDRVIPGTGNVVDVYPNGLPKNVLEVIDYTKFGAMLKQEQLLPPSYDRKPINVEIEDVCGLPRVILTFKSKTSESYRLVGIYKYYVSYSTRMDKPIKMMENNPLFIPIWRRFAESVMWKWENGYRFEILDKQRKGAIGKSLMQEDKEYIEHLKRMGDQYIKVIEEQHKDL